MNPSAFAFGFFLLAYIMELNKKADNDLPAYNVHTKGCDETPSDRI